MFNKIRLRYIVHLLLTMLIIGILFLPEHGLLVVIWFVSVILWVCFTIFMIKDIIDNTIYVISNKDSDSKIFKVYKWVINHW